ncbi:unnamed protein product, partial [Iphiclides podalirius]
MLDRYIDSGRLFGRLAVAGWTCLSAPVSPLVLLLCELIASVERASRQDAGADPGPLLLGEERGAAAYDADADAGADADADADANADTESDGDGNQHGGRWPRSVPVGRRGGLHCSLQYNAGRSTQETSRRFQVLGAPHKLNSNDC